MDAARRGADMDGAREFVDPSFFSEANDGFGAARGCFVLVGDDAFSVWKAVRERHVMPSRTDGLGWTWTD